MSRSEAGKPGGGAAAAPASRRAEILSGLAAAVDAMDEGAAVRLAHEALAAGIDAYEAVTEGLSRGMAVVSEKYDKGIYFVPEILVCADAMYAAIDVLRPHLKAEGGRGRAAVVIGVIEGDVHDIGKNIVRLMLEAAGFAMHDLGNDVAVERFVEKAREVGGGIVAASTLMSTTMWNMERLVQALRDAGLREKFRVMVGGGPLSASFARRIGADAYGANAMEAVRLASAWEEART
ncbi:MAG: cobalamin-binding protein [Planctomycetes bacterium]|nr:cobalamin-binding protein [Planctomycetota bacterium]